MTTLPRTFVAFLASGAFLGGLCQSSPATQAEDPGFLPAPSAAVARRVGGLIERLRQPNLQDRLEILDELVDIGPEGLPLLISELERRNRITWPGMVYAMGAIGDRRAAQPLRRELLYQTGKVYQEVLYALAMAGDQGALSQSLRSSGATLSFEPGANALDFIAGVSGPSAVSLLIEEIPKRAEATRMAALGALGTLCDTAATNFLLAWSRQANPLDRKYALMALARIGDPKASARMIEALADPDPSVREAAAEGVGYFHDPAALPALEALAKDPSGPARYHAIWSLGLIGGPGPAGILNKMLEKARAEDRLLLIQALGNTRDPAANPALAVFSLSTDLVAATTAIQGLARIPGNDSGDLLLSVCNQAQTLEAGMLAARALVDRRDPRATPCVLQRVRQEIDRHQGLGPESEDLLFEMQSSAPASVASSLDSLAEAIASPAIQHRLRSVAEGIRKVQELGSEVTAWLALLENGTPTECDLAVQRLGDLGDPAAVEPLRRLFGRIEPDRAWRIPVALGKIGSDRATPFLVSLLVDELYQVPSLFRAREEAVRALARYTRAPHAAQALQEAFVAGKGRVVAPLVALARLRGKDAVPALLQLKPQILRRRSSGQVEKHERVNWAIRMVRGGMEIPLEEIREN